MTRKTGTAYRITCPNDYPIEHEIGPCTVVSVTDASACVAFGAGAKGYDIMHSYETAVAGIVRKKFDGALKPLLLPPPSVTTDPRASFNLLADTTIVFLESPENVRDLSAVVVGDVVHVIVQFVGVRRVAGTWELDTAVTQIYVPPKKKPDSAVSTQTDATEAGAEGVEGVEAVETAGAEAAGAEAAGAEAEGAEAEGAEAEGAETEGVEAGEADRGEAGEVDRGEAGEADRREGVVEAGEAVEADRGEAVEAVEAGPSAVETECEIDDEMLTTEVEQDVESFWRF